jgi:hypothetical protein
MKSQKNYFSSQMGTQRRVLWRLSLLGVDFFYLREPRGECRLGKAQTASQKWHNKLLLSLLYNDRTKANKREKKIIKNGFHSLQRIMFHRTLTQLRLKTAAA